MAKPDRKLTEAAQVFICQRIGVGDTPKTIADAVKEEFGVEISRATVEGYDPEKMDRRGKPIREKWRLIVEQTRSDYAKGVAHVPIMHKLVRLERWERLYQMAVERNNIVLAAELLEKASKEAHDFYAKRTGLGLGDLLGGDGDGDGEEHRGGFELHVVRSKDGSPVN